MVPQGPRSEPTRHRSRPPVWRAACLEFGDANRHAPDSVRLLISIEEEWQEWRPSVESPLTLRTCPSGCAAGSAGVIRAIRGLPPPLDCWLSDHPNVASSIQWQFAFGSYDVPSSAKRPWPSWSDAEKQELVTAFDAAWNWLYKQPTPFANLNEPLAYPPVNEYDTTDSTLSPWTAVIESYARDLYLRWIGLNLAVEIGGHVPWSVTGYTAEQLQVLFDSASFMTRRQDATYVVCAGSPEHGNYLNRKDNLGGSLIAPPRFTLAFLRNGNIVGSTRAATIAQSARLVPRQPRALLRAQPTTARWTSTGNIAASRPSHGSSPVPCPRTQGR